MRAIFALLAALFFLMPATAKPPVQKIAAADWSRTVTMGTGGAFVLGNPRAPRLTEYVSYTCPHCAHFVNEASAPLKEGWIKRGLLSIEVRNAIRDPYDLTAAVLARCNGNAHFFADHEALFAGQAAWMEKVQAYEPTRTANPAKDASAQLIAIANGTGLTAFMAKRGLPEARQRACLSDRKTLDLLAAMATDAWSAKQIGGTPAFAVDGKLIDGVHDWDSLKAALSTALPTLSS